MAMLAKINSGKASLSSMSGRRPIDLVHLAKQSLGDPGLEEEILRMFDQMVEIYSQRVAANAVSGEVLADLHALKGASMGVGAAGIATMAKAAEEEAKENGLLSAETLSDLDIAVEEVRAFIAQLLDE